MQKRARAVRHTLRLSLNWTKKHRDQFGSQPQNEVVEFPSSNHYFFLEQPRLASRAIREFAERLR
jgi:hypothetical protein